MSAAKNVTVIPAFLQMHTGVPVCKPARRRTAGYARVSTDSDEQFTSYEAQVDYYTRYIQENPEWEFVSVYTDEGLSGLNTKHREGFNQMVQDALDGKIDLIVTKSVSRFARNTVDSLTTVRKLKEKGVEVYFQKENIWTLDSKGELLITIMSSLAQEESRSISENVTWGQRKRFADGKVSMPYSHFLGYTKGENGLPEIVPEQAETVRLIYRLFLQGKSAGHIAKHLTASGIPTPAGRKTWQSSTVESILTNEKYKGSALLQKKFTVDFLTKKQKVNEGEVPQYFVENSHPAIIQPDEWELVQAEMAKRKARGKYCSCHSPFSGMLICGDHAEHYGSKVWHSTSKYRRVIWQCNGKFKGAEKCTTTHLYEGDIRCLFLSAFSELMADRTALLEDLRTVQDALTDCTAIDTECEALLREMEVVSSLTQQCIAENATQAIDQNEYQKRYEGYAQRFEKAQRRYDELRKERERRQIKMQEIGGFLFEIAELDELPIVFDEHLGRTAVDHVTVYGDERLVFCFRCGREITEWL